MWPMLLNLTHDECRRTLRRLELEAYSNIISVFRAQGALEDNRKKLLEELRAVLHISSDRHSAEARRVSNDELLATIAHQLTGPNTGLGWISEGRRRVPLLPRGIPQTAYTEIADKTAEAIKEENKEILKNLEAEKLVAPKSSEEELPDPEGETAESALPSNDMMDEMLYPPVAMEDQTSKLWETELINRKRKIPEGGSIPDECTLPTKNMRNIPVNTNQKHLNLSQIYSKYTQPATNKSSGQSKHSYNQVSKVSTSKSSQPHQQRSHKHRSHRQNKNAAQIVLSKSQTKKAQEVPESPGKQFTPGPHIEYSGPPGSFQASYTQSILGGKTKPAYMDDMKPKVLSSPGMVTDSPTLQVLAQPAAVPHELGAAGPGDPAALQPRTPLAPAAPAPGPGPKHAKHPHHIVVKGRRPDHSTDKKVQMPEMKMQQKPTEAGIKVLSNRQVVVAPGPAQKALNTAGKVATTKVIGSGPKPPPAAPGLPDKMIIVSKPQAEHKNLNSKIVITSSAMRTPSKDAAPPAASVSPRPTDAFTPKGIPATDLKVSAKTFVLNQKPGQKMVVLPAKARTKVGSDVQLPLIHFKGIPTGMKLVPVSSQSLTHVSKSPAVTVVSKPAIAVSTVSAGPAPRPGAEPIRTANLADIVPVKGLAPVAAAKLPNPIVRPASAKGSVIVVQKGATIGKALSFTKNGNDMSKIIMGKNVNQLLQATKPDQAEASKCPGNVIVLELNNDQPGRTTTMSEILDSRSGSSGRPADEARKHQAITQDTPVLLEAPAEGVDDDVGHPDLPSIDKEDDAKSLTKDSEGAKDSSSVTDWEMELDTVSRKGKDEEDKLNSLHLDLGMSSDSDGDYMVDDRKTKGKHSQETIQRATPGGERSEIYGSGAMSIATRTLLSQLQDEGSSSNDSSFALKSKAVEKKDPAECDALTEAKEKLSEKVAEARSRHKRIDVYSTAISTADINLDAFAYLDENIMAGDDERAPPSPPSPETHLSLEKQ